MQLLGVGVVVSSTIKRWLDVGCSCRFCERRRRRRADLDRAPDGVWMTNTSISRGCCRLLSSRALRLGGAQKCPASFSATLNYRRAKKGVVLSVGKTEPAEKSFR